MIFLVYMVLNLFASTFSILQIKLDSQTRVQFSRKANIFFILFFQILKDKHVKNKHFFLLGKWNEEEGNFGYGCSTGLIIVFKN